MTEIYDPSKPNKIFLRPSPKARPIRYLDSIEESGMIIDGKHSIAMYTSRAGGATGPQGPSGHGFDTIIASCSDEWTPITANASVAKTTFRAPYELDMTNGYVRISLTTAPTGAPLIVDLKMNGTTVFSTLLQIDAASKTSVGSAVPPVYVWPALNIVPDDAEFLVYVTQVGSTVAGTGLKIAVTGEKTDP